MSTLMDKRQREEWQTPPELFKALDRQYHFTLDAAAQPWNALCSKYFTPQDNGIAQEWKGERVFCNPPSGRKLEQWVKKAAQESRHKNTTVVMLLPAGTDTKWFQTYICGKDGVTVYLLPGRVAFTNKRRPSWAQGSAEDKNLGAPRPSMVVEFSNRRRQFAVKSGKEFVA